MNQLREICDYLGFSWDDSNTIYNYYENNTNKIRNAVEHAYAEENGIYPICQKSPLERLVILCVGAIHYREQYREKRIPEQIIQDTLQEIERLARIYYRKVKRLGLSKEQVIWLRHIHHTQLFQIGSLQYQQFRMVYLDEEGIGEPYMFFAEEQKRILPPETPVWNIHIPTEADLSHSAVSDSLRNAKEVLKECFPQFEARAFLCYSWLLYPPMQELLPKQSNILDFASRFKLIGQIKDPYGSDAVRRIYGKRWRRKSDFPQKTALQRNAVGHFSKLGLACGIIEIT